MAVLDDLSGFEFEDVMEDVFRNLGYENVRQADRTADEGRDVIMEEVVDGTRRAIIVECKHTGTVGRPVVQKLHSAAATYDHDGPRRGMVVTSGRFTAPAEAYAEELRESDDPHPVELVDGDDLRELGEIVDMDLYNGRIEIVCEETLPVGDPELAVATAFEDVANAPPRAELPAPDAAVAYRPVVDIEAVTRAAFETSVGVIHRIDRRDRFALRADRDGPTAGDDDLVGLLDVEPVELSAARAEHGGEACRFGRTESEYRDVAKERLCDVLETTVTYTGDNNVTYDRECRPSPDDVSLQRVRPLYVPRVEATVEIGEYDHGLAYDAAGPRRALRRDDVRRCVHCGTGDEPFTYCENCGSISCESHTQTERLVGDPVCTGCSVTREFFYAEKHFFDEDNAATFREAYEAMPLYRKAMENPTLAAGIIAVIAIALLAAAVVAL